MKGLEALASMDYPGRFIISGKSADGKSMVVAYGVTGRSDSSKARKFAQAADSLVVRTEVTDPEVLAKGSKALLLYPAVIPYRGVVVAGNGVQTKLIYSQLMSRIGALGNEFDPENVKDSEKLMQEVMNKAFSGNHLEYDEQNDRWIDISSYEPDPCSTPRIQLLAFPSGSRFSIIKNSGYPHTVEYNHVGDEKPGVGHIISTYSGKNKNPLPSFDRPVLQTVDLPWDNPTDCAKDIFDALKPEYRVCVTAMYVKGSVVRTALLPE